MGPVVLATATDCPAGSSINKNHIRYFFMTIELETGSSSFCCERRIFLINRYILIRGLIINAVATGN